MLKNTFSFFAGVAIALLWCNYIIRNSEPVQTKDNRKQGCDCNNGVGVGGDSAASPGGSQTTSLSSKPFFFVHGCRVVRVGGGILIFDSSILICGIALYTSFKGEVQQALLKMKD